MSNDRAAFRTACRDLVSKCYSNVITWNLILENLNLVEKLQRKHGSCISPSKPMPEDYNEALHVLVLSVQSWMDMALEDLALMTAFNPASRAYYQTEARGNSRGYGADGLTAKPKIPGNAAPLVIVTLLNDLQDAQQRQTFGTSELLDEIERVMEENKGPKSEKQVVDIPMANLLSEMAAFAEIDSQMQQHQPKIRIPNNAEACKKRWEKRQEIKFVIARTLAKEEGVTRLCEPLSGFEYPTNRKRTEQNVDQLRAAEAKLDAFWQHIDQLFVRHTGKTPNDLLGKLVSQRELLRTAVWEPPIVLAKRSKPISIDSKAEQLQSMKFPQPAEEHIVKSPLPPQKQKTRGEPDPLRQSAEPVVEIADNTAVPFRKFVLPKKAYKITMALFPTKQDDRNPGKVKWDDFKDALSKLGFGHCQLGGSSVLFQPVWEEYLPICIHRPHPSNEIPFESLRRHGSRLGIKYGWTSESFILKESGQAETY